MSITFHFPSATTHVGDFATLSWPYFLCLKKTKQKSTASSFLFGCLCIFAILPFASSSKRKLLCRTCDTSAAPQTRTDSHSQRVDIMRPLKRKNNKEERENFLFVIPPRQSALVCAWSRAALAAAVVLLVAMVAC